MLITSYLRGLARMPNEIFMPSLCTGAMFPSPETEATWKQSVPVSIEYKFCSKLHHLYLLNRVLRSLLNSYVKLFLLSARSIAHSLRK